MKQNGNEPSWYSVNDAMETLGVCRRTMYEYINTEKVQSKKEGKYRFVWIDDEVKSSISDRNGISTIQNSKYTDEAFSILSEQINYLQEQNKELQEQVKEQSKRHDAIVLGLSNSITEQKLELQSAQFELNEEKSKGWFRRVFNF